MEPAIVLLVLLVLAVPAVVWAVRASRREELGRQDLLRAGDASGVSARAAALRGGGRSAWMRPGNFGG